MAELPTLGFVAGTGPLGRGLALRLATAGHEILLGSRDAARAQEVAVETLGGRDLDVRGVTNEQAAVADVVYLMFPWAAQASALPPLANTIDDRITITVVSPLAFDAHGPYMPPVADGSAAEEAARILPRARIASAFHDVAAGKLLALDQPVPTDILVCGDAPEAKATALAHADMINGARGIDAGPLRLSRHLEGLTAVLIAVNRRYKVRAGVRVTGLSDERHASP